MFGKKSWTDKLKAHVGGFTDERFGEYRDQIAEDLAQGVSRLAGLVIIWTLGLILALFSGLALAFLIAWLLEPWLGGAHYVLGFGLTTAALYALAHRIWHRHKAVWEDEVYQRIAKALRAPEKEPPAAPPPNLPQLRAPVSGSKPNDTELMQ